MRNILITGGLGYVGMSICKLLSARQDTRVTVVDSKFVPDAVRELSLLDIEYFHLDIFKLDNFLHKFDVVYHCASVTSVPQTLSASSPEVDAEIMRVGVDGTNHILKNMRKDSKIIFLSTHVIFEGLKESVSGIDEAFSPCPVLAYAKSKRQSEIDIENSGLNYSIVRLASVYGYGSNMRWKILPNLFSKMVALNENLKVFGSDNLKSIVGVKDVCRAIDFIDRAGFNKEIFNVVNETYTVKEIATICQSFNQKVKINITQDETPNKGYSITNKKLLGEGFQFHHNLYDEVGQMINNWRQS